MADDNIFDKVRVDKRKARDVDLQLSGSSLKSAYRESQNLPQAVLKVSSYSSGTGRAGAHLSYIARNGDLSIEDPQGNTIQDPEELKERIEEWSTDFDTRKNSRDTVNIILSAPEGAELGAVEESVRGFAKKTFGETNDYLFAIHNDTDHPHGHLMVKMRGYDGEKLNPGRKDMKDWRASFAESLRENGIMVDSSSRSDRGVGQKGTRQNIYHIKDREQSTVEKEAVKQVIKDSQKNIKQKNKPWAKAAKKKTQLHKDELNLVADKASEAAIKSDNKVLEKMANDIRTYAAKIPEPKTRAEIYQDKLQPVKDDKDIER